MDSLNNKDLNGTGQLSHSVHTCVLRESTPQWGTHTSRVLTAVNPGFWLCGRSEFPAPILFKGKPYTFLLHYYLICTFMRVPLNMHYIIFIFIKTKNQDNGATKTKFGMVFLSSKQENRMFSEKVKKELCLSCHVTALCYFTVINHFIINLWKRTIGKKNCEETVNILNGILIE